MDLTYSSSDGEISNDLSDISEDDYFDDLTRKIEKRKIELEVMNEIERNYDDYPKENRYIKKRYASNIHHNNNNHNNKEKSRSKDTLRNRSYRAPSVFSSSYSMPRRRKNDRSNRKRRKYIRQQPSSCINLSSDDDNDANLKVAEINGNKKRSNVDNLEETDEEDEEILRLRLQALTSKQEVKELIEPESLNQPSPSENSPMLANEEELLRIAALHSAVLKKKDRIKERKKLRKIENERPYSPDKFEPISYDDNMELSNSPLGSPFNDIVDDDEEVDMDISNSFPVTPEPLEEDNHETSDMEIASSPLKPTEDIEELKQPEEQSTTKLDKEVESEEEIALRSLLLSTLNEKKKNQKLITKNLKLAVERLKQQKQAPPSSSSSISLPISKSGTKTIKEVLEEKNKKAILQSQREHNQNVHALEKIIDSENKLTISESSEQVADEQSESFLLTKIIDSDQPIEIYSKPPSPSIEVVDTLFSTITDTKNIPLLPQTSPEKPTKSLEKRLITSLDNVIKPVSPVVISLQAESSEDEYSKAESNSDVGKKHPKKLVNAQRASIDFEQNLDNFLKNIRQSQEQKSVPSKPTSSNVLATSSVKGEANKIKAQSAVKHLPLSSQVEYENLLKKMQMLQQKKKQRHQLRQLKRTKSSSSATSNVDKTNLPVKPATSDLLLPSPSSLSATKEKASENIQLQQVDTKSVNKIDDTLSKIKLLDEAARQRLIEKTENNFLNHSKNLKNATEESLKLVEENCLQMKRRKMVEAKIQDLEKTLAQFKSILKVVNHKIKVGIPKVILAQRDMLKFRNHQHKFKDICMRVGESVCGEEYRLPDYQSDEIEQNFLKISKKTENLQHEFKEQYASKQLKLLADKVKSFVPTLSVETHAVAKNNGEMRSTEEAKEKTCDEKESVIESSLEENSVSEASHGLKVITDVKPAEEAAVSNSKRMQGTTNSTESIKKKIKLYESPLTFLKDSSSKDDDVNESRRFDQIVCPFALEGSCKDGNCKMLHL